MRCIGLATCIALGVMYSTTVSAQEDYPFAALDPKSYDRAVDPPYNMFIGHWQNSMPRRMHGSIVFRDILTSLEGDDTLRPTKKSAVLVYNSAISRATLEPGGHGQVGQAQGRAAGLLRRLRYWGDTLGEKVIRYKEGLCLYRDAEI